MKFTKKYIIFILLCISITFVFCVSCGKSDGIDKADKTDMNAANINPPADNNGAEPAKDAEAAEEETVQNEDIFGAISEIVGNLTTINLAVMPETGIPVPMNRPALDPDNLPEGVEIGEDGRISFDPNNLPEGIRINGDGMSVSRGDRIDGSGPVIFGEGALPENFDPNNIPEGFVTRVGDGENGMPSGARSMMGGMFLDYTGEEKEFIIPVGLPVYALTRDDDGNEVETGIELADIQTGNVISVTYREDRKTIDKIIVSQITAMKPSEVEEMRNRINNINNINNMDNSDNNENIDNGESGDGE